MVDTISNSSKIIQDCMVMDSELFLTIFVCYDNHNAFAMYSILFTII